jgi:hypothetical protein
LAVYDRVVVVELSEVVNQFALLCHILIPCFVWIASDMTGEDI